ncbi:MAG: acyltransferase family protein [Candidatus Lokiarchaeota archaeon]|nr:acyltransferase family protein [Candidatus Lokiarchaeota archaeon]
MEQVKGPRLIGLDIYRGFLVWMMIFFHNLDSYSGNLEAIESSAGIASVIGKFIGRWGVFFFIIVGFSNTLSLYHKFQNPKANSGKILLKSMTKASILIAFDKICTILFSGESQGGGIYNFNEGPISIGIVMGFIKTSSYIPPRTYDVFFDQSAVVTIAYIMIIISLIEVILFKSCKNHKSYPNLIILASIGFIILIISPFAVQYLRPLWVIALVNENYGIAFILGILVGDVHPLLPNIGFAFIGAVFALAYAMRIPRKLVLIFGSIFSFISLLIGIIGYIMLGEPSYEQTLQTSPGRTMWLLVGVMIIPILFIYYFEFEPSREKSPNRLALNLQRFGKVSLTLYLLESFVVELSLLTIGLIYPIADTLWILAIFGALIIILLSYLLILWERGNFIGSVEWMVRKATLF